MSSDFDSPYDPENPTALDQRVTAQVRSLERSEPITIRGFRPFTLLLAEGFTHICYAAEVDPASGQVFWITEEHAQRLGRSLERPMRNFSLNLTTFEGAGAILMADAVPESTRIDEVIFSHKSADEVTHEEARGFARLVTRVQARAAHLWAGEFDPGSLEVLHEELVRLGNHTLMDLDICDITRPEPEDRIHDEALEALTQGNRGRHLH